MKITLSSIASTTQDTPPQVIGDVLIYRSEQYNLFDLPDGAEVEADEPFVGKIKRVNGQIELTLQYHYNSQLAEPYQSTDINDYIFVVEDGYCTDPITYKEVSND